MIYRQKNILNLLLVLLVTIIIFIYPETCQSGVKLGINISMYSLIPSILPFMLLSNYIIKSGISDSIGQLIHPLFGKIFGTTPNGSYGIFMGFLCGFPLGSKIICDLIRDKKISLQEGKYLFNFINNPSPSFIICYLLSFYYKNNMQKFIMVVLIYFPSILIGVLTSFKKVTLNPVSNSKKAKINYSFSATIEKSITDSFSTITKLSGYIIIFCILSSFISRIHIIPDCIKVLLYCTLEITSGVFHVFKSDIVPPLKLPLSLCASIIGGLCVVFQICGVTSNSGLSIWQYLKYKTISIVLFLMIYLAYSML